LKLKKKKIVTLSRLPITKIRLSHHCQFHDIISCCKTNALIHFIQALGPISHNIFTTELNVHAKNFTKDLLCINKLDNKHTVKKFQTKSFDYEQANLVKITHARQNFKTKDLCIARMQRVHNLACVEKSYFSLPFCLSPSRPSQNM